MHTGTVSETVISAEPCILYSLLPAGAALVGTIIVRDDSTATGSAKKKPAEGSAPPVGGLQFDPRGITMLEGITIQISNAADKVVVVWSKVY